jgi:DNA polymerase-1
MNPYNEWYRYHVDSQNNWLNMKEMQKWFQMDKPTIGGWDTETTGLHIIKDKAFLMVFGWLIPNKDYGRVFTFYPTPENMKVFLELSGKLKQNWLHNTKFDLSMIKNIGYEYPHDNLYENMALGRLTLEAIPARDGGDSLKLKDLGVKYVHHEADRSEKMVKDELEKLNAQRVKILAGALKQFPLEGEFTPTGKQKYWGKGAIEKFLKSPENDVEDLPEDVRQVWVDWQEDYPEPTYADVDREVMIKYAGEDVITMLEFVKKAWQTLLDREQLKILELENRLIKPLWRMERVGLKVDREYLEASRLRVKAYIKRQRNELRKIAGEELTCNQHDRIKQIFYEKWGMELEASDKPALKKIIATETGEPKRFAQLIKELRTLEKWYSTYIKRILDLSSYDGRAYTQINQCSAVSGRVGSDFQQFPKDALNDEEGNELYHPRKPFTPTGGNYDRLYYLDYSQIELRVQANYTILVSGGDPNLCRAYMPFQCYHKNKGYEFDCKNPTHLSEIDCGLWVEGAKGTYWTPTDVHAETTHNALVLLDYKMHEKYKKYEWNGGLLEEPFFAENVDEAEFKRIRSKGKIFNFMKNYGGGLKSAMEQLDLPEKVAQALIDGYSQAFPHVITYQKTVARKHRKNGYIQNMYGRRYYIRDHRKAYKLSNYGVQGTCADAMKEAIILMDEYIQKNNLKTRLVLPVHDEQQVERYKGEDHHIKELLKIMEEVFDSWCLVPVVCDMEMTETTWYDKEEVI